MLITVSGMVGSGKTTIATRLVEQLRAGGRDVTSLSFQTLPCFALLRSSRGRSVPSTRPVRPSIGVPETRWPGYQRKPLTFVVAVTYVLRIMAFRLYRLSWPASRTYVLNRYFYDLFVHYHLNSTLERFYYSVIRVLVPSPDVSFLLVAPIDTIARRRVSYAHEYLTAVHDAYERLSRDLPGLVELRNDQGDGAAEEAERILRAYFEKHTPRQTNSDAPP